MRCLPVCISIFVFILCSVQKMNASWILEKDEAGIKVYTRNVEGSSYKECMAEIELSCPAEDVVQLIKDADNYTKWLHNCSHSKLLKRTDESFQHNYTVTKLPFPFQKRDMVFEAHFTKEENKYIVKTKGVPKYIPAKNGITRMNKSVGSWVITTIDQNRTKVIYKIFVEPGGTLPSWLTNLKVVEIPYFTMSKMRQQLVD